MLKDQLDIIRAAAVALVEAIDNATPRAIAPSAPQVLPSRASAANLQSIADFAASTPFTEPQLRWWVLKEADNGLRRSGAVVRIGRRVYVDPAKFERWIEMQQSREGKV